MTPRPVFDALNADYLFTRDGAASICNHLLPRYWSAAHNTLEQVPEDGERIFTNPPFGMIYDFLEWGLDFSRCTDAFFGFLLPHNGETDWWHDLAVWGDKHTFKRRISYKAPRSVIRARLAAGKKPTSPSFASAWVMFGRDIKPSGYNFTACRDGATGILLPHRDFRLTAQDVKASAKVTVIHASAESALGITDAASLQAWKEVSTTGMFAP